MNSGDLALALLTVVGPLALLGGFIEYRRWRKWQQATRDAEARRVAAKLRRAA